MIGAAAVLIVRLIPLHIASYKKIKIPIVVVVEKSSRCGPPSCFNASFLCNIGERPVAVVMVEDILPVTCNIDIGIAIVVIVSNSYAHAVVAIPGLGQSCSFGNVGKGSILVLP